MRYIYYILIIFFAISAIIGFELKGKHGPVKDAALIINDRVITTEEFNKRYFARPLHEDKSDFINSLITKELLIQESQKQGIDKDESFRISIQNFYEQSLIKLLIDRKFASLNISVSPKELDRYIALLNKKIHITIFGFDSIEQAGKGVYKDGENKTVNFDDLSDEIRYGITLTGEGKFSEPLRIGEKYIVVRLDKIESASTRMPSDTDKDKIKMMIAEVKKEKIINDWMAGLRKNAKIKIMVKEEN